MRGRVLIVAGSDSGGGAGIQADIRTVTALGGYAMTAITALTVQDTLGVHAVHDVPPAFVAAQITRALDDPGADAIKIGMVGDAARITAVADALAHARGLPVVVDPVMVAKGGSALLDATAMEPMVRRLLPLATLLTPNLPEATALLGRPIESEAEMVRAAGDLRDLGAAAVLLKGGHLPGPILVDVLATPSGAEIFRSARIMTRHTHGTGCTLASAVAVALAQGAPLRSAVARAQAYVRAAIAAAPGFGRGHGPLGLGTQPA